MLRKLNIVLITVLITALAVVLIFLGMEIKKYNQIVVPNVYYNDTLVSGYSFNQVKEIVKKDSNKYKQNDIKIVNSADETTATIRSNELNWNINTTETINAIINEGHNFSKNGINRLFNDFKSKFGKHPNKKFKVKVSFDEKELDKQINTIATDNYIKSVNASIKYQNGKVIVKKEAKGQKIDKKQLKQDVSNMLINKKPTPVVLKIVDIKPKIISKKLPKVIVVKRNERKFYLYKNNGKLEKSYRCAVGRPGYETPYGNYKIVSKQHNSTWHNPGSAWAANMPATIGPGPSNPMGVHKIGINVSGIYFHGIPASEFSSIGSAASHGCMRMLPRDVADLYKRVKVGTLVYIR